MTNIAIIGLPNVGKSSFFNRVAKQRIAITSDVSGTTRDIKQKEVEIEGKACLLIDTGGLDDSNEMFINVRDKSLDTSKKADVILMMVDGKSIPTHKERKIFYSLQKLNKPIALVINKIDNDKEMQNAWEFSEFGARNVFAISVSHNRGVNALCKWLSGFIQTPEEPQLISDDEDDLESFLTQAQELKEEENKEINIGIIGRTNVGKSSLLNALVGEQRSVVSSIAGTTIDPVDEFIDYNDYRLNFVDTAGLRKRGRIEGIERYALLRTNAMLEKADIALLVLDASEPFRELDERIASLSDKNNLATIIVLNKWDAKIGEFKELTDELKYRYKFLAYAPIITLSALSLQRVHKLKDLIIQIYQNYTRRIPTSKLNDAIKIATTRHHLPSDKTKEVKIYFATQYDIKPPRIVLVMNRPRALHFSYRRYLVNKLRENFDLQGTPVLLMPRKKGERDEEQNTQ